MVEGPRMFAETPIDRLEQVYVSESFFNKEENRRLLGDVPAQVVSDRVFESVSDTKTPQGVLCLVKRRTYGLSDILPKNPFVLLLEDIQDPGNLGTIFRTAEAAGVTGIFMSSKTADLYNPKTIRSTMGSIFRVPHLTFGDPAPVLAELKKRGVRTFAAELSGTLDYTSADYRGGCAFFIGNEGNGLSAGLSRAADCQVRIPMAGQVESLNAAVAAAILMFEAGRQRKTTTYDDRRKK